MTHFWAATAVCRPMTTGKAPHRSQMPLVDVLIERLTQPHDSAAVASSLVMVTTAAAAAARNNSVASELTEDLLFPGQNTTIRSR